MRSEYLLSIGAIFGPSIILDDEIWRLITAMFLHGGIEHIAMNMLSLWFIGRVVESWFDRVSYISIYFISGIVGGLVSIYMHPITVGIGASGAIFGIFGALSGMVIVHRKRMEEQFKSFMKQFGIILLLNLVIGVVFQSVDLSAHIAGLIVGMIGGAMVAKSYKMIYIAIMTIFMILFYSYLYSYLEPLYISVANVQF